MLVGMANAVVGTAQSRRSNLAWVASVTKLSGGGLQERSKRLLCACVRRLGPSVWWLHGSSDQDSWSRPHHSPATPADPVDGCKRLIYTHNQRNRASRLQCDSRVTSTRKTHDIARTLASTHPHFPPSPTCARRLTLAPWEPRNAHNFPFSLILCCCLSGNVIKQHQRHPRTIEPAHAATRAPAAGQREQQHLRCIPVTVAARGAQQVRQGHGWIVWVS
jgi:hypothetical protein